MLILANENFPGDAVEALRNRGHDVLWVRVDMPGSNDGDVLSRATADNRILITFDKDFGELAFRAGLPASSGIILFRIPLTASSSIAELSVKVLESRTDWSGHFSVIEANLIRMTPLPPQKK